jgi:acyl carrier protein
VSAIPLEEVERRLKKLLSDRFAQRLGPQQIDSDTPLWKSGLRLDSVAVLEFIVGIEEEFAILLSDSTLTVEHFQTLGTLARYLQGLLATRGDGDPR